MKDHPEDTSLVYAHAEMLYREGRNQEAKRLLYHLINDNERFIKAYALLAELYLKEYHYDSVLNLTDRIQSVDPGYLPSYYVKAKTYRIIGRNYSALDIYKKILEINPNDPIAMVEIEKLRNYLAYLQSIKEEYENRPQVPEIKSKSIEN